MIDFYHLQKHKVQTIFDTVLQAHVADVQGDIAEFGTDTGLTAECLALGITISEALLGPHLSLHKMPPKNLHLFDSFEGLPMPTHEADTEMPHVKSGCWAGGTMRTLNEEKLLEKISPRLNLDRIQTFAGWHSETVKRIPADTKYAVVHGDSNLYQSTIDYLDYLFAHQHISEGAFLLFDDYNSNRASLHLGERRAWRECIEKYNIQYTDFGNYGQTSHRFIVHEYSHS